MATNYPTSLDALTNPVSTDTLASPDHAVQHQDINDAVEAIQAKLGVNDSAVTTSLDYLIKKRPVTFNAQVAGYTLVLSDMGKFVEINSSSSNSLIVPSNASVAFPIGTVIDFLQTGIGQTTITADMGVTINTAIGLKLRARWSPASLVKRGTDTWVALGDLSA